MIRISMDDEEIRKEIKLLKKTVPEAEKAAAHAATKLLAEQVRDRVIELIPDEGGWYDLYKESIKVVKLGSGNYEVTTDIMDISYGRIEAESSLIWLIGRDLASRLVGQKSPWTLDTLPSISGGLNGELTVRAASAEEVEVHREGRLADLPDLFIALENAGATVGDFDADLPKVNGRVMADVPFLALRLEHGLGGFPRTPVWTIVNSEVDRMAADKSIDKKANEVFSERWRG